MQRFLILTALIFALTPAGRAAAEGCSRPFVVGWTDIPPAFYVDAAGKPVGIDFDILRAVLALAGCRFEARHMPFKRYVEALKFGLVDIVMSASKNEERQAYAHFSHPYRREQMVLFTTPERLAGLKADSFVAFARTQMTVAAGLGMWLGPAFTELYEQDAAFRARTLLIDGYPAMLKAVLAGRVDTMIGDSNGVRYLIEAPDLKGRIVAAPVVVHDNDVHFMFSRKTVPAADMSRIDAAIVQFVGSPDYMAILRAYPAADPASLIPQGVE